MNVTALHLGDKNCIVLDNYDCPDTKNNFMQSTKQLLSLGLTVDDLQTFITSKTSDLTPVI